MITPNPEVLSNMRAGDRLYIPHGMTVIQVKKLWLNYGPEGLDLEIGRDGDYLTATAVEQDLSAGPAPYIAALFVLIVAVLGVANSSEFMELYGEYAVYVEAYSIYMIIAMSVIAVCCIAGAVIYNATDDA